MVRSTGVPVPFDRPMYRSPNDRHGPHFDRRLRDWFAVQAKSLNMKLDCLSNLYFQFLSCFRSGDATWQVRHVCRPVSLTRFVNDRIFRHDLHDNNDNTRQPESKINGSCHSPFRRRPASCVTLFLFRRGWGRELGVVYEPRIDATDSVSASRMPGTLEVYKASAQLN